MNQEGRIDNPTADTKAHQSNVEKKQKNACAQRTELRLLLELALNVQRVRAARIRPAQRKGDLGRRSLLQQQLPLRVEEEDGEGAVQQAGLDVAHQVAWRGQYMGAMARNNE